MVFFVLILPFLGISVFFTWQFQQVLSGRIHETLESGTEGFITRSALELQNLANRTKALAQEPGLIEYTQKLLALSENPKAYAGASIDLDFMFRYFESNVEIIDTQFRQIKAFGRPRSESSLFQELLTHLLVYGSAEKMEADRNGLHLYSMHPLLASSGTIGYLLINKDIDRLGLDSLRLSSTHEISLLDSKSSRVLYTSLADAYGRPLPSDFFTESETPLARAEVQKIRLNNEFYYTYVLPLKAPEAEGILLELAVREKALSSFDSSQPLIFIMLILLGLLLLSSVLLSRTIIKPIVSLSWAVDSIRRHIREYTPLITLPVHYNDELGDLSHTINDLARDLRQSSEKVEEQRAQIAAYTQSLEERVRVRTHELDEARIRAEIANKHKSRFLVNMNHELRTPLNSIAGMTDLLRFGAYEKHEELAELLADLSEALEGQNAQGLKDQLTELSRKLKEESNYSRALLFYVQQALAKKDLLAEKDAPSRAQEILDQAWALADEEERSIFKAYNAIRDASDSLLSIIDEVINLSQVESGIIQISKKPCKIRDLIQTCLLHAESYARSKGKFADLEFLKQIDPEVPESLLLDQQKIKQVILNLLTNGVKYTEKGFVSCKVDILRDGEREFLRCSVQDTGLGITSKDRESLFMEFSRSFEVREIEGSGLGLALSKRLIERHGGTLDFTSERNKGSLFWFTLPLEVPQ